MGGSTNNRRTQASGSQPWSRCLAYVALMAGFMLTVKYVLSVMGFRFPLVFQGWQTAVGFLTLRGLAWSGFIAGPTALDRSGFVSLFPGMLLFALMVVAGSKAMAELPLHVFVAASNALPALCYLASLSGFLASSPAAAGQTYKWVRISSAAAVIGSAVALTLSEGFGRRREGAHQQEDLEGDEEAHAGAKFWLYVYVGCGLAMASHGSIADQRYSFRDRLFHNYGFAFVLLLPASLYLEEAFEALKFAQVKQVGFLAASVLAALLGVSYFLTQASLKEYTPVFGPVHHLGQVCTACLSIAAFQVDELTPWWAWFLLATNLVATFALPSYINKDEKIAAGSSAASLDI